MSEGFCFAAFFCLFFTWSHTARGGRVKYEVLSSEAECIMLPEKLLCHSRTVSISSFVAEDGKIIGKMMNLKASGKQM
jgi:hypothetical protein